MGRPASAYKDPHKHIVGPTSEPADFLRPVLRGEPQFTYTTTFFLDLDTKKNAKEMFKHNYLLPVDHVYLFGSAFPLYLFV